MTEDFYEDLKFLEELAWTINTEEGEYYKQVNGLWDLSRSDFLSEEHKEQLENIVKTTIQEVRGKFVVRKEKRLTQPKEYECVFLVDTEEGEEYVMSS